MTLATHTPPVPDDAERAAALAAWGASPESTYGRAWRECFVSGWQARASLAAAPPPAASPDLRGMKGEAPDGGRSAKGWCRTCGSPLRGFTWKADGASVYSSEECRDYTKCADPWHAAASPPSSPPPPAEPKVGACPKCGSLDQRHLIGPCFDQRYRRWDAFHDSAWCRTCGTNKVGEAVAFAVGDFQPSKNCPGSIHAVPPASRCPSCYSEKRDVLCDPCGLNNLSERDKWHDKEEVQMQTQIPDEIERALTDLWNATSVDAARNNHYIVCHDAYLRLRALLIAYFARPAPKADEESVARTIYEEARKHATPGSLQSHWEGVGPAIRPYWLGMARAAVEHLAAAYGIERLKGLLPGEPNALCYKCRAPVVTGTVCAGCGTVNPKRTPKTPLPPCSPTCGPNVVSGEHDHAPGCRRGGR